MSEVWTHLIRPLSGCTAATPPPHTRVVDVSDSKNKGGAAVSKKYTIEFTEDLYVGENEDSDLWENWGEVGDGRNEKESIKVMKEMYEDLERFGFRFRLVETECEEAQQ